MKKTLLFVIAVVTVIISSIGKLVAQTSGDYRSKQSGGYESSSTWETYNGSAWVNATQKPGSSNNVTVSAGHIVTLNANEASKNLTISATGQLKSGSTSSTYSFMPYGSQVTVDGIFGAVSPATGDMIAMQIPNSVTSQTLTGSGTTRIASIKALAGNASLIFVVDQNVELTGSGIAFSALDLTSTNTGGENVTFTINTGKTVTLTSTGAVFHLDVNNTAAMAGNYTYNVYGSLNLSASTATSNVIPVINNASSLVILNVTGLLVLGGGFNTENTNTGPNRGVARFYISNNGVVDATASGYFNMPSNYFITTVNARLKRAVGSGMVTFPIAASENSYNPVTISNSGTPDNFSVGVSTSFDVPPPDPTRVVQRQWYVEEEVSGGSVATLSFQWKSDSHGTNFNETAQINIIHYDNSQWHYEPATITGSGTDVSPFVATTNQPLTQFSPFGVESGTSVLPLKMVAFNAKMEEGFVKQARLDWRTSNEVNTSHTDVQRSLDGEVFEKIGEVKTRNSVAINSYTFFDANPARGTAYYRLKTVDNDGAYEYSKIVSVNNDSDISLAVYPNPAVSSLTVSHPKAGNQATLQLISLDGRKVGAYKVAADSYQTNVDVSSLNPGYYILEIGENGKNSSVKFIKQ